MSLGYMVFPSLAAERDQRNAYIEFLEKQRDELNAAGLALTLKAERLQDQLAEVTLKLSSAEAKLNGMQNPAPLEPKTIKVASAADVRRLVEQQNFRDEQENSDGIR